MNRKTLTFLHFSTACNNYCTFFVVPSLVLDGHNQTHRHQGGNHLQYQYALQFSPFYWRVCWYFQYYICLSCWLAHWLLCPLRRDRQITRFTHHETMQHQPHLFDLNERNSYSINNNSTTIIPFSCLCCRLPYSTRQDHHHSYTGTPLDALHRDPPLACAPWHDITICCYPTWILRVMLGLQVGRIVFQVFHLLVSVMLLAMSWFGITFGFGFNKAGSVGGSL